MIKYWTKERILEEGKKYKTKSEFHKSSNTAYNYARINGYLDEMDFENGYIKRTNEQIKEEGKKYNSRNEFRISCPSLYRTALTRGLIDIIFPIQEKGEKKVSKSLKWNEEKIRRAAEKYEYRMDFCKKNHKAYTAAIKRGMIDELFEDKPNHGYNPRTRMENRQCGRKLYWTKKRIFKEGRKYKTRLDFKKGCYSAYHIASLSGYLDEIFRNKPNNGYIIVSKSKALEESNITGTRNYWNEEKILKEVLEYPSLKIYCRTFPGAASFIDRNKLRAKIKEYRIHAYNEIMTIEDIKAEAAKYATISEFRQYSCLAYNSARYRGLLKDLFLNKKTSDKQSD